MVLGVRLIGTLTFQGGAKFRPLRDDKAGNISFTDVDVDEGQAAWCRVGEKLFVNETR